MYIVLLGATPFATVVMTRRHDWAKFKNNYAGGDACPAVTGVAGSICGKILSRELV